MDEVHRTQATRMMSCTCLSAGPERMTSTLAGQTIDDTQQSRNTQAHVDHEAMRVCSCASFTKCYLGFCALRLRGRQPRARTRTGSCKRQRYVQRKVRAQTRMCNEVTTCQRHVVAVSSVLQGAQLAQRAEPVHFILFVFCFLRLCDRGRRFMRCACPCGVAPGSRALMT